MINGRTPSSALKVALAALVLAGSHGAFALDPSLDISQYAHTTWKLRDGFTRGMISAIAQTPDGYLWLGTEFGLLRFDGVHALPWRPPAGEELPGDQITSLVTARDGALWIGTRTGVARLQDGRLARYPQFAGQLVNVLLQDRKGVVWLGVDAPGRLCGAEETKVTCEGEGKLGKTAVSAAYEDRRGNFWISASTGVWRWRPGPPEHVTFSPGTTEANDFIEDESGLLVAASGGGLKRLAAGRIESHPVRGIDEKSRPIQFLRSSDGSLWIGTLDGLYHLHQGRADRFSVVDGLSGEIIMAMYEDREKTSG